MIKIYHNPRCRKSREGLALLDSKNVEFEVVKYLENPIGFDELKDIIDLLGISPIELIRKTEKIWKENFKGKDLSDSEIIKAMVDYPKLIERPIVVSKNKAVIGRPSENINHLV
ncbi:MAG: arsenate reductase (glutaredoxin) [Polaribacter sp.]|jgi:arsenate reductase